MKKLPKRVYVTWEDPGGNEEPFLLAQGSINSFAVAGEGVVVGVYELVNKGTIVAMPELLLEK